MSISERVQKRATDLYTTAEPHVLNAYSKIDPYVPTVAKNAAILAGNTTVSVAKVGVSAASSAIDLSSRAVGTVVDINVKVSLEIVKSRLLKRLGLLLIMVRLGQRMWRFLLKIWGLRLSWVLLGTLEGQRRTK